ncbi:hypothetical protein BpHYR1_035015 [Brachionus plicatilis]|uniref:Uncharacterized protein n=1 Tax=Brachionus plicatilis TaxID=10195 RepID=A0A3M7SJZ0_BRAPC|nr:hypothetical protein BpHYR1_035015 [Brachionus plicatilis]
MLQYGINLFNLLSNFITANYFLPKERIFYLASSNRWKNRNVLYTQRQIFFGAKNIQKISLIELFETKKDSKEFLKSIPRLDLLANYYIINFLKFCVINKYHQILTSSEKNEIIYKSKN